VERVVNHERHLRLGSTEDAVVLGDRHQIARPKGDQCEIVGTGELDGPNGLVVGRARLGAEEPEPEALI
jgi:hypothetical protein